MGGVDWNIDASHHPLLSTHVFPLTRYKAGDPSLLASNIPCEQGRDLHGAISPSLCQKGHCWTCFGVNVVRTANHEGASCSQAHKRDSFPLLLQPAFYRMFGFTKRECLASSKN